MQIVICEFMPNVKTKELIERVKKFIIRIISLVNKFPKTIAAYRISGQLIDAVCSTGANLTEAQAARSRKEFVSIIGVVLKECKEVIFWLDIVSSIKFLTRKEDLEELVALIKEGKELANIFGRIIITTSKSL